MGKSYYYLFYKYDFFTKKNCVGFYSKSFMITEIGLSCSALFSLSSANGASQTESVCQQNKNESPAAYTTLIIKGTPQNRVWTLFKNNFQISRRFFFRVLYYPLHKLFVMDIYFVENHILLKISRINMAVHNYNTRYAANQNLCRPFSRTNYGLARFSVVASQTWEATPMKIKCLPLNTLKKEYKLFLLDSQASWTTLICYLALNYLFNYLI